MVRIIVIIASWDKSIITPCPILQGLIIELVNLKKGSKTDSSLKTMFCILGFNCNLKYLVFSYKNKQRIKAPKVVLTIIVKPLLSNKY